MHFYRTLRPKFNPLFHILIAALLSGAAASCTGADSDSTDREPMSADIDSLFQSMFAADEPGAVVLVAKGDSVLYTGCFGKARLDTVTDIDPNTLFNICSLSKQFSAVALLKLQEEKRLSIDDTVAQFFPEFHSPLLGTITLRQLLSHTSGIPDIRPRNEAQWHAYRRNHNSIYANVEDYMHYSLCNESVRYLTDLDTLAFEPGTRYEYQNPTYQLVLPIVERTSGDRFEEWMSKNIFTPAGMTRTTYFRPEKELSHFAHGYIPAQGENRCHFFRSNDGRWEESDYGEANFFPTKADGGMYCTATDFFRWTRSLLTGKIISAKSLKEAFTPHIKTNEPYVSYGLGFFLLDEPGKSPAIYHTGDNGGFFSYERYDTDSDIFYLIFANRNDWSREETAEKMEAIFDRYNL